jgi:hypothetical protein
MSCTKIEVKTVAYIRCSADVPKRGGAKQQLMSNGYTQGVLLELKDCKKESRVIPAVLQRGWVFEHNGCAHDIVITNTSKTNITINFKSKNMKNLKFKQGEWCFCEFKLQQVMETEDNKITSVSDGMFRLGSSDLSDRCYPLDMGIKQISDTVSYWSDEFHKIKINGLNHPDLNRELIQRWVDLCDNKDNADKMKELYESLSKFGNAVKQKCNDLGFETVECVTLFRR